MIYRHGDVVLVPFPFTDLTSIKQRPAVVVSSEFYHQHEPDLIIAAVTSQVHRHSGPTGCLLQDWREAGLLKPSVVKAVLATIEPHQVRFRIGNLSHRDLMELERCLRLALGL
jgi:mRNA interferase MazF